MARSSWITFRRASSSIFSRSSASISASGAGGRWGAAGSADRWSWVMAIPRERPVGGGPGPPPPADGYAGRGRDCATAVIGIAGTPGQRAVGFKIGRPVGGSGAIVVHSAHTHWPQAHRNIRRRHPGHSGRADVRGAVLVAD